MIAFWWVSVSRGEQLGRSNFHHRKAGNRWRVPKRKLGRPVVCATIGLADVMTKTGALRDGNRFPLRGRELAPHAVTASSARSPKCGVISGYSYTNSAAHRYRAYRSAHSSCKIINEGKLQHFIEPPALLWPALLGRKDNPSVIAADDGRRVKIGPSPRTPVRRSAIGDQNRWEADVTAAG